MQDHINFCKNTYTDLKVIQDEMNDLFNDTVIPSDLWPQMQYARNNVSRAMKAIQVAAVLAEGVASRRFTAE